MAQAVYLLSATDSNEEHERQNLSRIHRLLTKMGVDGEDRAALQQSLQARKNTGMGLAHLTEQDKTNWRALSGAVLG